MAGGYGDVLCLRKSNAVESNSAVKSSARRLKRRGYVEVLCLRGCSAVKSNKVVESSARKQRRKGVVMCCVSESAVR
jgi:hypothetical protein